MKSKKSLILFVGLIVALLAMPLSAGCMGRTVAAAQGWSGIAGADGQLHYLTTVPGTGGGGFLGCGAATPQSQLITLSATDGGVLRTMTFQESTVFYGAPVIVDGIGYLAGYNGLVYRVDTVSGGTPKSVRLGDRSQAIVGGVAVAGGRIFVASVGGSLYALDANTLDELWEFSAENVIWSTPIVSGDTVYIGSFDRTMYALDVSNGQKKWSYTTDGAIVATPIVSEGMVYVASLDRHLYALDIASGDLTWQFPAADATDIPNWFWATPVLIDGKIYAPNTNGQIYVINAEDGNLASELTTSGSIVSSPVIVGEKVVFVTEKGDVYVVNTTSQQFDGNPFSLRTVPASGTSNTNLIVRATLSTLDGLVYIQTTNPSRVFEFDPNTKDAREIGTKQSVATSPPPSSAVTVTVTVTTTG